MAQQTLNNLGTVFGWVLGYDGWKTEMDRNLVLFDLAAQAWVSDKDLTAPPGSPSLGDRYIVGATPTGDWTGREFQLAVYDGTAWVFAAPKAGWRVWVADESKFYRYDGAAWVDDTAPVQSVNGNTGAVVLDYTDVGADAAGAAATAETNANSYTDTEVAAAAVAGAVTETVSGTTHDLDNANKGKWHRFTNAAAKTLTVRDNVTHAVDQDAEFLLRNVGAADLTISPAGGVTVNLPTGGSLVVPQGGTVVLKRVAADEFDLSGYTVPA